jgi:hypothetical protein
VALDDDSILTAYCGLYYKDCIPSRKELFFTAARLDQLFELIKNKGIQNWRAKQKGHYPWP